MNFDALRWAKAQGVTGSSKAVLVALAMHVDKEGWCYPAITTLADLTGKSERTVQRALRGLETLGYVLSKLRDRNNGSYTSSEYYLFMGQSSDMPDSYMQALADFWERGGGDMVTPPGDMVTPPGDMVTPLEYQENTNRNRHSNFFSSSSLFLGEFEKTTLWLTRVFRKPLLEKLFRERPQRQMLWLALPREKINSAIQEANAEVKGSFLTNLKDYLDLYANVDALQKEDFPAAPKNQAPPQQKQSQLEQQREELAGQAFAKELENALDRGMSEGEAFRLAAGNYHECYELFSENKQLKIEAAYVREERIKMLLAKARASPEVKP